MQLKNKKKDIKFPLQTSIRELHEKLLEEGVVEIKRITTHEDYILVEAEK